MRGQGTQGLGELGIMREAAWAIRDEHKREI